MFVLEMSTPDVIHNCFICQSTTVNAYFHCPNKCVYHKTCIKDWVDHCNNHNLQALCPNCKQPGDSIGQLENPMSQVVRQLRSNVRELQMQNFGLQQTIHFMQAKMGHISRRQKSVAKAVYYATGRIKETWV